MGEPNWEKAFERLMKYLEKNVTAADSDEDLKKFINEAIYRSDRMGAFGADPSKVLDLATRVRDKKRSKLT